MAICVLAGPGSRLHAAKASSNSWRSIQGSVRSRSSATCAGGPPKPSTPIRPHSRATVARETAGTTRILSAMGTLFDAPEEPPAGPQAPPGGDLPLAARMRPRTLEEFVGQQHLLGPSSALRTAIQSGEPH